MFGYSVSVDGDTVVVGAHRDDNNDTGSAYVFVKPSTGWASTVETAELTATDGAAGDQFGWSVSVEGDTVVAGAYGDDNFTGSAYVFVRPSDGEWATTTETAKLTASDGAGNEYFGSSVSVEGDTVVVGASLDDDNGANSGSAYVFVRPSTGWATATETGKLTASDGARNDYFGLSVSVYGNTVVVGAERDDDNGSSSGSAYVFVKPSAGWADATETAKLTASDGAADDEFGGSVSVEGDTVVVGASLDDDNGAESGSAYVFLRPSTGWSATTTETAKMTASDGTVDDRFGRSVSVDGDTVVVGANQDELGSGSAYAFAAVGWARIGGSGAGTVEHTVEELAVRTEHTFSLRGVNGGGPGPASRSVTLTPLANSAPAFAEDTATLEVAENTGCCREHRWAGDGGGPGQWRYAGLRSVGGGCRLLRHRRGHRATEDQGGAGLRVQRQELQRHCLGSRRGGLRRQYRHHGGRYHRGHHQCDRRGGGGVGGPISGTAGGGHGPDRDPHRPRWEHIGRHLGVGQLDGRVNGLDGHQRGHVGQLHPRRR